MSPTSTHTHTHTPYTCRIDDHKARGRAVDETEERQRWSQEVKLAVRAVKPPQICPCASGHCTRRRRQFLPRILTYRCNLSLKEHTAVMQYWSDDVGARVCVCACVRAPHVTETCEKFCRCELHCVCVRASVCETGALHEARGKVLALVLFLTPHCQIPSHQRQPRLNGSRWGPAHPHSTFHSCTSLSCSLSDSSVAVCLSAARKSFMTGNYLYGWTYRVLRLTRS